MLLAVRKGQPAMNKQIHAEWQAILARRLKCCASGIGGQDLDLWLKHRGIPCEPQQLELFQ